jgi:corrinoid protein of di/trimethylamine methyltransferase
MNESLAISSAKEVIEYGYDAFEAIDRGLAHGMKLAGDLFEEEEYFVPELILCSDAMNAGIEILKPHIKRDDTQENVRVVLGVVEGDTHDIGKNLVKLMVDAGGFEVFDLGRDVPAHIFVEKAIELNADVLAMSTLMTTTMAQMAIVINLLKEKRLRDRFLVVIGGGPISQKFADTIGADAYSSNASEAVRLLKRITSNRGDKAANAH